MEIGNNIFISLDGNSAPFAGTKSNEIQTECETIEISSPNTGEWKQYITSRKEWNFTISWLVGNVGSIQNLLDSGQTYVITIYGRDDGVLIPLLQGSAICKSAKVTASLGDLVKGSFSFLGNGPLEAVEQSGGSLE